MTAKEYMNRPFELNRQIRIRRNQLQGVRNIINGTTTAIIGIPKQDSHDPHRLEGLMARAVDFEAEISNLVLPSMGILDNEEKIDVDIKDCFIKNNH